ncbi:MAG: hypothetical protein AB7N80_07210 [Bdellovibrionales bacterium]
MDLATVGGFTACFVLAFFMILFYAMGAKAFMAARAPKARRQTKRARP